MRSFIVGAAIFWAATSGVLADGVVKPTGYPPRFPSAYPDLAKQAKPPSNNWLLDADDDVERFRRLQVIASGTDIPMWEIGYRYEELYTAILKNNPEMGLYHWDKLRDRMNAATMKRPARTKNMEGMFLESGEWQSMREALVSRDGRKMREEFRVIRQACMECHVTERVKFLNDSSVFQRTESFPPLEK